MSNNKLTLIKHLEEIRNRIIKSIISVIACSVFVYCFIDRLLPFLTKPIGELVFIAPQEAFVTNIQIAFFGGVFLSSPVILYQVWRFVSRGLKANERKYVLIFGPLSFLLFVVGCAFGYFLIVPLGIRFLLSFSTEFITPMISISKYISFLGLLTMVFGLVFQLPLVMLFLTKIGVVNSKFLSQRRREAIVIIFIAASLLTPPDVITQVLMALPLIVLYELGIIFSKFG